MKTVAFDCKGTLWGGGEKVHKLFKWFESKGCNMIIWSSVYSYAVDAQKEFGYKAEVELKRHRMDKEDLELNPDYYVDIAIDDDNYITFDDEVVPTIGCHHMILVHEIPEDESEFEAKYGGLVSGSITDPSF